MTEGGPGFAPLSSDEFDALLNGENAAENLEAFLEQGLDIGMSRIKNALNSEVPGQEIPAPTARFSSESLVPPPKRKATAPSPEPSVNTVAPDIEFDESEPVDIPLRPVDKTPTQQLKAKSKTESKQMDTGKVKDTRKKTKAKTPVTASSTPDTPDTDTPDLRKVSGELLERKLKERQDKLGDVFKDKGTLS